MFGVKTSAAERVLGSLLDKLHQKGAITPRMAARIRALIDARVRELVEQIVSKVHRDLLHQIASLKQEVSKSKLDWTGVMSSTTFKKEFWPQAVQELVKSGHRHQDKHRVWTAIMVIDIKDFKSVNDTMGHTTGDVVLQKIVEVISVFLRKPGAISAGDVLARWGGDEFVVFLPEFDHYQHAFILSDKIIKAVNNINWEFALQPRLILYPPRVNVATVCIDARSLSGIEAFPVASPLQALAVRMANGVPADVPQALARRWFEITDSLMYYHKQLDLDYPIALFYQYMNGDLVLNQDYSSKLEAPFYIKNVLSA